MLDRCGRAVAVVCDWISASCRRSGWQSLECTNSSSSSQHLLQALYSWNVFLKCIPEMPRAPNVRCMFQWWLLASPSVFLFLKVSALTESAPVQGCNVSYWISVALINRSKLLQKIHVFSHYTDNFCVKVLLLLRY